MVTDTEFATAVIAYTLGYLTRFLIGIAKQAYKDAELKAANKVKEATRWDG